MQNKVGYVYIFKTQKFYKIGTTKEHSLGRIDYLQACSPFKIKPIFIERVNSPFKIEARLHRMFKKQKTNLKEWFILEKHHIEKAKTLILKHKTTRKTEMERYRIL